ncbi:hypothetical protein EVAR_86627_1 [Eumeta japonica]|uniref:Uncharacterized protein n=1 Tax=Eumeta variegata TaxID=151549 RepID=A0A4C1Z509_EUMVA|nr:hypothetical protein EVAR_86627_1 [Eumeta japonica]
MSKRHQVGTGYRCRIAIIFIILVNEINPNKNRGFAYLSGCCRFRVLFFPAISCVANIDGKSCHRASPLEFELRRARYCLPFLLSHPLLPSVADESEARGVFCGYVTCLRRGCYCCPLRWNLKSVAPSLVMLPALSAPLVAARCCETQSPLRFRHPPGARVRLLSIAAAISPAALRPVLRSRKLCTVSCIELVYIYRCSCIINKLLL